MPTNTISKPLCWICTLAAMLSVGAPSQQQSTAAPPERVAWTSSRLIGSPDPRPPYRLERAFEKLSFQNPVLLTHVPSLNRLLVVELNGRIYSFPNRDAVEAADLVIDLRQERPIHHVYGFAFHPQFPQQPYCYVCYTLGSGIEDGTRVVRFRVELNEQGLRIDEQTETLILTWLSGGHNGGCLAFGRDGCLYISTGDGGPAFPPDPLMSGQDVGNLLSAILRIDVDRPEEGRPYSIPADNPFAGLPAARGEIWAYGLRNPWRMSFDSRTGDLWVGDVGWELWEMVYRVQPGDNYGWSLLEGPQPVHRERAQGPTAIVPPVAAHSHIEARSITGGYVYRGTRLDELTGAYVYGDYVTGKIWALRYDGRRVTEQRELADTTLQIICFGTDQDEELYVVGYDGAIHRLVRNQVETSNSAFPQSLSETGLFQSAAEHQVAPGVLPYSINAEPWMDGASAERFIALPGRASLGIQQQNDPQRGLLKGHWEFPPGAVLVKTITLPRADQDGGGLQRVETQILHKDGDTWRAYSYHWNEQQTDAFLAPDRAARRVFRVPDADAPGGVRQQAWEFASRTQCMLCHASRGGFVYGFRPAQLDRPESDTGSGTALDAVSQLDQLQQWGVFDQIEASPREPLVNPYDETADLDARARSYLHVNCAHCHRRGGGGTAVIELEYHLSLERTRLLGQRPTQGTFGLHSAEVVAAGDPFRSVLFYRMAKLGRGRMPYLGSSMVDGRGLELLRQWIESLPGEEAAPGTVASRATQRDHLGRLSQAPTPTADSVTSIDALLGSTSGALMLADACSAGDLPHAIAKAVVEAAAAHADVQIRDLFEQYLPESERSRRLGPEVVPGDILALAGDSGRGRELFERSATVQCRSCHRLGGVGQPLGPDLAEVTRSQSPAEVLQSILEPSRKIDPKFMSHIIETEEGRVLVGLIVQKDERQVVLRDAQNQEHRIAVEDIAYSAPQQKSLMPELLAQDMAAQELADLLAYLIEAGGRNAP